MLIAALTLVAGLGMSGVHADTTLDRIKRMLARPSALCGEFVQRKTLKGLQHPVRSDGKFCVATDRGVVWNTRAPFPSMLKVTRDEIVEQQNGRVISRMAARQEPAVEMISTLLFSVLAGDFSKLESTFTISASVDQQTWRAHLVPRDDAMRHVIAAIELTGGDFVREVVITEASGDSADIALTNVVTGPDALRTEEMRALVAPPGSPPPAQR